MRVQFKSLVMAATVACATACGSSAFADEPGVLYWMVSDPTIIAEDGTEYKIADYYSPTVKDVSGNPAQINAIRVAACAGGETVYLDMYADFGDGLMLYEGMDVVEVEQPGSWAGPMWADLGKLEGDYQSFSFAVELWYMSDDGSQGSVIAVSGSETYAALNEFIRTAPTAFPADMAWNPGPYAVPEPSGALLMLIGAALMALRRKEVRA